MINDYFNKLFNTRSNYFTPEGFFILWEWIKGQKWHLDFIATCNNGSILDNGNSEFDIRYINPEIFVNKLFNFITDGDTK